MSGDKFDSEKIMTELVAPEFILAVAMTLTYGAKKYDAENWRKGIKYKRIYGGVMRHLLAWYNGEDNDPESSLPHLWHAATGLMFLITYTQKEYDNFDDRVRNNITPETLKDILKRIINEPV